MMGSLYLKHAVWDFALVAVAALSLTYTVLNGFYVSPALQYSVVPAVVCIVCLAALFFVAQSKRTVLPGGVAYGAALVVAWVVCAVLTPDGAIFVDSESNYLIFSMAATITPTICFLLSRSRLGTALLFIAGAFVIGLVQLFYERFEIVWTVLFVLAALSLVVYKYYEQSVRTAMGVDKVSFAPGFATAVAATAAAVLLGVGVWFAIIAPLNPGAADIKLVTEYRALETVQVRGTSDEFQTPNLDMTSDVTNDDVRTTDDIKEDVNGTPWPATGESEDDPEEQQDNNSILGMNLDSIQDAFDLQSNPQNWPLIVILLAVVALIALYFVLRRVWRERRLAKFKELGADKEYERVFLFLLDRFRRLGVTVPPGQTMLEFGTSSAAAMRLYNAESGVAFKDLAAGYSDMAYGMRPASSEDVSKIEAFYRSFWKACRKQLGSVKYFFKSFHL